MAKEKLIKTKAEQYKEKFAVNFIVGLFDWGQ